MSDDPLSRCAGENEYLKYQLDAARREICMMASGKGGGSSGVSPDAIEYDEAVVGFASVAVTLNHIYDVKAVEDRERCCSQAAVQRDLDAASLCS
jgi:hypothetical protein